jgi:hypothetical protein
LETGLIRSAARIYPAPTTDAQTPPPTTGVEAAAAQEPPVSEIITGEGVLFPALVIGLGQVGLNVLQSLRGRLYDRFGSLARFPTTRLLEIDTDPEVVRAATRGSPGTALSATEVMLAELNRPSHYLKHREGRPELELDKWMNRKMLYRIPRSQVTTGIRALGRLAFCDHYRAISRRLYAELKASADVANLRKAGRDTGLGVRTSQPRVYIVANLAGGTGGGMFLDLAYTARAQLKKLGFEHAEIVGLFFLPAVDGVRTRTMALGNTYAALKELQHFGKPGTTFKAVYHEQEPPFEDNDAPFFRCALLPLPDETDEPASRQITDTAGQALFRDLCSPMGRIVDELRGAVFAHTREGSPQRFQSLGLYHVVWPRRTLLQQASRRICHHLVQRWLSKDSKPIRDLVREWVQERWHQQELAPDHFITRLRQAAEESLEKSTDQAFHEVLEPLIRRLKSPVETKPRHKASPIPELTTEEIREAFDRLLEMVGKPQDDNTSDESALLVKVLHEAGAALGTKWEQRLAEIPVYLIETPAFRLAGAEEAIRQITATIEQILQHHEPLAQELTTRSTEAYMRLQAYINPPPGSRRPALSSLDLVELLRHYPKWRFQSVVLQQLSNAFLRLRGHLSDDLREVNFCRVRLAQLLRLFEAPPEAVAASEASAVPMAGRCLFPSGCANLNDALEQFLACLSPEDYLQADQKIEEAIRSEYRALVHICLTPANILKKVETLMLDTGEAFAGSRLAEVSVTDMFLGQYENDAQIIGSLASCFDDAKPLFCMKGLTRPKEIHVLAAPPGPDTDHLRGYLKQALPGIEVHAADNADDIVVYREIPVFDVADLDQCGAAAQDAYRLMRSTENFTPHTRIDIQFDS